jgi:hypothetical protein
MIAIKTRVDGHDVPLTSLGSEIEQVIYLDIAEGIRERLKNVQCPEHAATLEAIVLEKNDDRPVTIELLGCCPQFVAICEKKLNAAAPVRNVR